MKKYVIILSLLALALAVMSGCSSDPFNAAFNNATDTPTRTPRPTFTPKPSATVPTTAVPTSAAAATATDTPAVTDTPEAIAEAATDTPKPVVKATRPPAPPPQPTQPPAPTFAVHQDFTAPYFCPQEGSVDEVSIYVKQDGEAGHRPFAGGLWFGAFAPGGGVLKDGAGKPLVSVTAPEMSISYGSNCQNSYDRLHPDARNGNLDVGDIVRTGTKKIVVRFIRSQTDYAPISADVPLDFSANGRWWLYFGYAGGS